MTEEEWLTSRTSIKMFEQLEAMGLIDGRASCRKYVLHCEAPRPWRSPDDLISEIVASVVRGDQRTDEVFLAALHAWNRVWASAQSDMLYGSTDWLQFTEQAAEEATAAAYSSYDWHSLDDRREPFYADLFRDIFGNPFRPVTFAPEWRTEAAVGIAAKMYDSRDFGNMPILADALQDAGCEHPEILNHCREPGTHVRGCWVVDLVLGKS